MNFMTARDHEKSWMTASFDRRGDRNMERYDSLQEFENELMKEEYSLNTIKKYIRDVKRFLQWNRERELTSNNLMEWKRDLIRHYAPTSINSMLASLNHYLEWLGYPQFKVRFIPIQQEIFAKPERELSGQDYRCLLSTAEKNGKHRLALILKTLALTGIRISELEFITVESLKTGIASIWNKGKARKILLPVKLCRVLREYCKRVKRESGSIFVTRTGRPLNRSNIWREMKSLFKESGVAPEKIFPHNFRHLFARTFYSINRDLVRLSDLLGHNNLATTRIYIRESGNEHRRILEKMERIYEMREKEDKKILHNRRYVVFV